MKNISDRLTELQSGIKLKVFAEKLEVSPSTLHYYIKGRPPPADFIIRICEIMEVNELWLLKGEGPKYREEKKDTIYIEGGKGADPNLISKLDYIYSRGSRRDKSDVRGPIEEVYDELTAQKKELKEKNKLDDIEVMELKRPNEGREIKRHDKKKAS